MKTDRNGCSTCPPGAERYEQFWARSTQFCGRVIEKHVQYDYRDYDGELFSCVARTLAEARVRRDQWVAKKHGLGDPHESCGNCLQCGKVKAPDDVSQLVCRACRTCPECGCDCPACTCSHISGCSGCGCGKETP